MNKIIKLFLKNLILMLLVIVVVGTILYIKEEKSIYSTSDVKYPISNAGKTNEQVYAVGLPIGMHLKTNGIMVVSTGVIITEDGKKVNPSKNKIKQGDYITKINDQEIYNKKQMLYWINNNKTNRIKIQIERNNNVFVVYINPVKGNDGKYYIGVWVRDDTQGIGTMTFITRDYFFGALGHGISDLDTGKLLESSHGNIYFANIWGVKKGQNSNPGGLCGYIEFSKSNIIGNISNNCECGLYGHTYKKIINKYNLKLYPVGNANDAKTGKAKIQFIYDNKIRNYDIEIIAINKTRNNKNFIIQITDKNLLKMTNGIVQGMSGCPIIQDGKIIGAVTHVMVDDPSRGYGIFIDTMLNEIK